VLCQIHGDPPGPWIDGLILVIDRVLRPRPVLPHPDDDLPF
jgi:hypothetical protein